MVGQDDGPSGPSGRAQMHVIREAVNMPAWCKELGLHWESLSTNGEAVIDGVLRPRADLRPLSDWLSWNLRNFGSHCRGLFKQTGALSFRYRGRGTRTAFVRCLPNWDALVLKDTRAICHRLAERGADVPSRSLPGLWMECEGHEYWCVPGGRIPYGKPRKFTKLVIMAEERQVFVPARPTPLGEGTKRRWRESLGLLAALDPERLSAGLRHDEQGFLASVVVMVHRERSESAAAVPTERCYERHEALVSDLRAAAAEPAMPIAWDAVLRLPLALTCKGRFPAVSFAVAMRALPRAAVVPAGNRARTDGLH